jgi:hypothetical protein
MIVIATATIVCGRPSGGGRSCRIISVDIGVSLKARPSLGPGEFLAFESIAIADIDRPVGGPLPTAVMNMEVMAMSVVMAVMTMPVMAMAMPVVTVMAMTSTMSTVAAVTAMTTVTVTAAGESLTWDGQRCSRQRQSSDSGCNYLPDPGHAYLLGCAVRGSPCDDPT